MTLVKIILPWRASKSRQPGCDWLVKYWSHRFGAEAVVLAGDGGKADEPFNKSRAVNAAVEQWPDHVCLIADADVLLCDAGLAKAIELAATNDRLYVPFNRVCRMSAIRSERFLRRQPDYSVPETLFRPPRKCNAPGGMWVVRGEFFLQYRMDERFVGWGGEDSDMLDRIPWQRLNGTLFHIWHKQADRSYLPRNKKLLMQLREQRTGKKQSTIAPSTLYQGVPMQQHPDVSGPLSALLADYPPDRILEIGTAAGGLALLLRDLCPGTPIRTYDVRTSPHVDQLVAAGIDARTADALSPEVAGEVTEYVQGEGRTLIICDGGDKPAEVRYFAGLAKPGDVIMAHDYARDREYFDREMRGKRWNWCEITGDDIADVTQIQLLEREDLAHVAWIAATA